MALPQENKIVNEGADQGLLDVLIVLAQGKWFVAACTLLAAVIALAVSFALPNAYKASTKILPPQQAQSGAAALLAQLSGVAGPAAGAAGIKNPNALYIGMLKSRTIADKLIDQFKLQEVYELKSREKTRSALADDTVVASGRDGLITIEVEARDSKLVAPLANGYANELLKLTRVLALTESAQRRKFFEAQLEQSKDNLAEVEAKLRVSLDTDGVVSVDSDSRAIVETVARLRAQIAAKEIQIRSMQAFVTNQNQDYKRAVQELSSLQTELARLQDGQDANRLLISSSPPSALGSACSTCHDPSSVSGVEQ